MNTPLQFTVTPLGTASVSYTHLDVYKRQPYIDQAASLNLFIPADVEKWDLLMLHYRAWELGIKSLYYLRSKSVQRAGFAGGVEADNTPEAAKFELSAESTDYDECLACQ